MASSLYNILKTERFTYCAIESFVKIVVNYQATALRHSILVSSRFSFFYVVFRF